MPKTYLTNRTKYIIALGILFSFFVNVKMVQAGDLNANEAAVVSAAQGVFELNGEKYKVDPTFIQQLSSYLNQDGIDLTAEQKDEAIATMFSNVGQGISEGYLVPAIEGDTDTGSTDSGNGSSTDTVGDGKDSGKSSGDTKQPDKATGTKENDSDNDNKDKKDDKVILNEIRKQPVTVTKTDQDKNKVTVKNEKNNSIVVVNTVIKNTGYDLTTAFIIGIGLLIMLVISIIITLKFRFFRQEEQKS
ncbi:hypothetical protein [Anaerocolumna chitinilytica]|uniref:Uncharacterized protein n=1 Tax=Anaerocolumna chitinilytica TaxID=1727145 RepID=A0A7I8DFS9_9FIRM|nr:hypothetical protein [Anaerocolumna chitinilytica]BCJ97348.1 hypothetical protein bsdcttw_03890 [Anaerocolumna chitinilytica]